MCEYLNQCFHTLESISLILWIMHFVSTASASINTVCYAVILHTCQSYFSVLSQCCGHLKKLVMECGSLFLLGKIEINSILNKTLRAKECNSHLWMWEQCGRKKILNFLYLCEITKCLIRCPRRKIGISKLKFKLGKLELCSHLSKQMMELTVTFAYSTKTTMT